MSLIPIGVGVVEAGLQGLIQTAFFQTRRIGGFVADVTIEELHVDELRITDHPVDRNAVISDHAFKLPMHVNIRVGYSNSSPQAEGNTTYVNDTYEQFLALQESRQLITILTGKRMYQNMLLERLSTSTDEKTENSMILMCECREIIIVSTQVTQLAPPQNMTNPSDNAGVQANGAVATTPATGVNQSAADATFNTPTAIFGSETTTPLVPGNTSTGTIGPQTFNTERTVEIPIANQAQAANPISTFDSQVP